MFAPSSLSLKQELNNSLANIHPICKHESCKNPTSGVYSSLEIIKRHTYNEIGVHYLYAWHYGLSNAYHF